MGLFEYGTSETRPQYDMEDYFVFEPKKEKEEEKDKDQYEFKFS